MWRMSSTGQSNLGGDFQRLWAAYAVSEFGTAVGAGALPLLAIMVLNAPAWQVSLLAALSAVAAAAVALPLGVRMDRSPKLPYLIGADVARFVALASLPAAAALGVLSFVLLCVVGAVNAAAAIVFAAASAAHVKALVSPDRRVVATSRLETTFWTATAVGPPLGGAIVSAVGALATATIDAVTYLVSALFVRRIRTPEPAPPLSQETPRRNLTGGWQYVARRPDLRALFANSLLFGGAIMLAAPVLPVLMLRDLNLAPWQYGIAVGVPAVGGIVGSLMAPRLTGRFGQTRVLLIAGTARTLWLLPVAFAEPGTPGLVLITTVDTLLLLCAGIFNPTFASYRLNAVDDVHLARVLTTWSAATRIAQPLFIAVGGVLVWWIGPAATIGMAGALLLMTCALLPWTSMAGALAHSAPAPEHA